MPEARGLDLRGDGDERGDVRDPDKVARAIAGCRGVVHLAAVSRVIDGEREPARCESVNVGGLRVVIEAAQKIGAWVLFASSREVYGQATLPVHEDAPLQRQITSHIHSRLARGCCGVRSLGIDANAGHFSTWPKYE